MEPRPASPCTEHTLRQGLLISALLLTIWNPLTTAQLTIESVPPHAVVGKKLLLRVHNPPGNLRGYFWYREKLLPRNEIARLSLASNASITGPAHTGREVIYHNGSLLIRNLIMNDTGVYILQILDVFLDSREASVKVQVYLKDIQEKSQENTGLSGGGIAGIVVGVVVGVALIGALVYFLYISKTGGPGP